MSHEIKVLIATTVACLTMFAVGTLFGMELHKLDESDRAGSCELR